MASIIILINTAIYNQLEAYFRREHVSLIKGIYFGRWKFWEEMMPLFLVKPIWGYGFGSSHFLTCNFSGKFRSLHNSYLEIFGDLGFIGLVLISLLLSYIGKDAFFLIKNSRNRYERNLNAVFVCCFAAGLLDAITESWMFSVGNISSALFWVPAITIVSRSNALREQE